MSSPQITHRCSSCGASLKTALFCPQCGKAATPAPTEHAPAASEGDGLKPSATPPSPAVVTRKPLSGSASIGRAQPSTGRELIDRRVKPRVDKLRQASSVVLGEATYDPSVRFVLVVAVLFVLFLVLVLFNKWLG